MRRASQPRGSRGSQRGQALTEMAILAVVLVPLFLLVPTLGKYFHIKQTAQQAARSAAWAATVTPDYEFANLDATAQRQLVLDRHFSLAMDPISSQASGAGDGDDVRNEMMNSFSDHALLRRGDVTLAAYTNESGGRVTDIIKGFSRLFELMPGGSFPPNRNGLVTSEITLRPRNLVTTDGGSATFLDPFHNLDLEMSLNHTVLADAWNAAGNGLDGHVSAGRDRSVHEQVRSMVPMSAFAPVGEVLEDLEFMDMLPVVGVLSRFRPGYIQPDIVPNDKLEAYTGP